MARMLLICVVLLLGACQRPPMVMPTMFEAGQIAPLADTPEQQRTHTHTIFYATDRKFDPDGDDIGTYGPLRNDSLSLGQLKIGLGEADAWQRLSAATLADPTGERPRPTLDGIKRMGRMEWGPAGKTAHTKDALSEQLFIEHLDTALKQSKGKAITIFVHGFKNSFEEAALTTAELSLYSGGLGPYILYSWPSMDKLFEYSHDRDSVRYTTAHARRFVEMLASEIEAGHLSANRINLIAHSSGAEVVGSVLRELGLMSHNQTPDQRKAKWKIGQVLLIAPDISTDVARERILKEDLRGMFDQIVVYMSKRDGALRYANKVLYRVTRIGSLNEDGLSEPDRHWLNQAKNVTLIDIDSQPNNGTIRHSHHRHSGAALSDMLLNLRADLPPEQRGLTRQTGEIIWRFAADYDERITEAAKKVYDKAPGGSPEQ